MRFSIVVVAILACQLVAAKDRFYKDLYNKQIIRTIHAETSIVRVEMSIEMENRGSETVDHFYGAIPNAINEKAWFMTVETKDKEPITFSGSDLNEKPGSHFFKFALPTKLAPGGTAEFTVTALFVHQLTPFPAEIKQEDRQKVVYKGNHYIHSPYESGSQKTLLYVPGAVESHSVEEPTTKRGQVLSYGPYDNVPAYSFSEMNVHFENNSPFIAATEITKDIEVSHWGNVAVEVAFALVHEGAKLKGNLFSRYEYQRGAMMGTSGMSSVKSITMLLPEGAADVYYRDAIGNISTSAVRENDDGGLHVELRPRFPLFGGWKTESYMGYNLPTTGYLFTDADGSFVLNATASDNFVGIPADRLTVRVTLPEGADNVKLWTHPGLHASAPVFSKTHTYLDVAGRPVVTFTAERITPEQALLPIRVTYSLGSTAFLREPLLLIAAYFVVFVAAIIYNQLDFSISKRGIGAEATRFSEALAALAIVEKDRAGKFAALEATLSDFRAKGKSGGASYRERRLALLEEVRDESKKFDAVVTSLGAVSAEHASRAATLQAKEAERLEAVQQQHTLYTRNINGELNDDAFADQIAQVEAKITVVEEAIDNLLDDVLTS